MSIRLNLGGMSEDEIRTLHAEAVEYCKRNAVNGVAWAASQAVVKKLERAMERRRLLRVEKAD